ncbi:nucleoporin protein Ndc1-Nup [Rhypophila decipiens]|uniref:Nucleoporin protein Ndc1-Nup n=1 Tax=Rhypophila decipiens TaxID=261697 RepID=A0AAN6XVC3_9PEZI|nr:nucleoporin protein Ndc1-Nup [Rhypophila decipiens]
MASTTVRKRPYKDFLQPALHRRFSVTVWILVAISYLEAVALSSWSSFFWFWFPIGPTGIRALFLSICALSVIILRIAQYHVGLRTSDSGFETFRQHGLKLQTAEAIVTYVFSSYIFSQVYLWSLPDSAGYEWVTYFTADRARLNERTIFFTTHFVILGIAQALVHVFKDNDRLSLGTTKQLSGGEKQKAGEQANQYKNFWDQVPNIIIWTMNMSLAGLASSIIIYALFLRTTIWRTMLFFLRPFYSLPRTNMVPVSYPFSVNTLFRCWIASLLMLSIWTVANVAFSIFLVKEPLKKGKPLTSESKDPNGSLLNGLKSKKLAIKAFAMWELAFIARDYPERRKALYEDIDRQGGPMWSQVYTICMEILKEMETRVDWFGKPPQPAESEKKEPEKEKEKKRISKPPKEDAIFQTTPQKKNFRSEVEKTFNKVATSPTGSQLSPVAKRALESAKQQLREVQIAATGSDDPQNFFKDMVLKVLRSPLGWPFRQEYRRRLEKTVLGSPYGEPSLLINATNAIAQLAVHSLKEDKYGNVQRDVAAIIRTFTTVTKKLDTFKGTLPVLWTDVVGKQESKEVEAVLEALKSSLRELVQSFGPYARDLRLSLTDVRLAKEAAGTKAQEGDQQPQDQGEQVEVRNEQQQEMRQVR